MPWGIRGLIEGFYGEPWSWDSRVEVLQWCAERGMTHYVYAPKDDPKHRDRWRELYDDDVRHGFERLVAEAGLEVGFAISPGLSIDYASGDDRRALLAKLEQVTQWGVRLVCLALDDIPFRDGLGEEHAELTSWLAAELEGRASLLLVPTEYVGARTTPYLDALAAGVPAEVPIGWTGDFVVNDEITAEQARARAAAMGGRAPLLWDNFPVNDAIMGDRLYMGPVWGRDAALAGVCSGYLANPMVQPRASKLALASIAAWLRGDDPVRAWATEADALGWRTFAEACDGAVPSALVQALADEGGGMGWQEAAGPLGEWLLAAKQCDAPGLEGEAAPWLDAVRAEAGAGVDALRLIEASRPLVEVDAEGRGRAIGPDDTAAVMLAFRLMTRWQAARRSAVSVLGPRCSVRPMLGQRDDGRWYVARASLVEGANALDALARVALGYADELRGGSGVEVHADGARVALGDDGTFQVRPGATVLARCGGLTSRVRGAGGPPLGASSRFASTGS